ncbi:MAG: ribbon-helix-helix domain-containing protein [Chloroflexi bacterium]|nr:ribbon-helix-helix domain-containing protein [Chloroflexota bacterium]
MANKILVSLPEKFLEDVDLVAAQEHRSRSELIREALRAYMETRQVRQLRLKQVTEGRALYGDFASEFNAWDIASDEALTNFEKGLDKP